MNNTNRFLHLACRIHVRYELLRSQLVDLGLHKKLFETYSRQKHFFPDRNTSEFWDDKFEVEYVPHPMADARESIIASQVKGNLNILNIGVGRGNLEQKLWAKFNEQLKYYGTDITPKTINNLKKRFPKWNFLIGKPTELPFSSFFFDQVMLLEVLEHIKPSQTFKLLGEVSRVCKKNAKFILSVPVNEGLVEMLPDNPNSHMRLYTEQLVSFELTTSGFTIDKVSRLSAFQSSFSIKSLINDMFHFRKPNNLIFFCHKR